MIKKIISLVVLLGLMVVMAAGCRHASHPEDQLYWNEWNSVYMPTDDLEDGGGRAVRVVLLLGQSNATGCSLTSYLKAGVGDEKYAEYEAGYENVRINYCLDNHTNSSDGEFVTVGLNAGAREGYFGPEVGIAEKLSATYPDEDIYILKYTMSGYSLHHNWLYGGDRGSLYEACMIFINQYMGELIEHNYSPTIEAVMWMQGESDTSEFKAERYFENQCKFVSYLREDLAKYADGEIYFIDAGISSSPYCEPGYPEVNEAKRRFATLSEYNIYFSTIDAGLTTLYEPVEAPDLGHYDAMSELALGHIFGDALIRCLGN